MTDNTSNKNMNSTPGNENKTISILICSRDRRKALQSLCSNLLKLDTGFPFEIIVVEETDTATPIPGVNYVSHPVTNRGISYARNLALTHTNGEILVFLDDDCTIHDQWLDKLLAPFQNEIVVGVQGGVIVPRETNAVGWAETILGFPGGGVRRVLESKGRTLETREISTLNCAYRKRIIDRIGGFDERLKLGAEDYILAKQACEHGRCLFVPDAMVSHKARGRLDHIWRWFIRRGRADIDAIRVTGWNRAKYEWLIRSSLLLKIFFFLALCVLFPSSAVPLTVCSVLLYFLSLYVRYYKSWKMAQIPIKPFLLIPVVKFVMDLAIDAGRIMEIGSRAGSCSTTN
jgi:GT2 family glycosyltransferase